MEKYQVIIMAVVRHLLTAGGGALGVAGLASDANVNTVAGFVMFALGLAMSLKDKKAK